MLLSLSNSSHFAKIPFVVKTVLNYKKTNSRHFLTFWGTFLECGVGVQLLFGQCPNELRFTVGLPLSCKNTPNGFFCYFNKEKLDILPTNNFFNFVGVNTPSFKI